MTKDILADHRIIIYPTRNRPYHVKNLPLDMITLHLIRTEEKS